MEDNYDISLVIFAAEQEKLENTYESIKQQKDKERLQVVIVLLEPEGFEKDFLEQLKADSTVVFAEPDYSGDLLRGLKHSIKGNYVAFAKAGVRYLEGAFLELGKYKEKESPIIIAQVRVKKDRATVIREHNAYCRKYSQGMSLEEDGHLLHNLYMGYLLPRKQLCWAKEFPVEAWYFALLQTVFGTVMEGEHILCVRQGLLRVHSGRELIQEWNDAFQESEGVAQAVQQLIRPLISIAESPKTLHKDNAGYVVLYYLTRLMNALAKLEDIPGETRQQYQKLADTGVRNLCRPEYVIANQYINKINKKHLLETYFQGEADVEQDGVATILCPEYSRVLVEFFQVQQGRVHTELRVTFPGEEIPKISCSNGTAMEEGKLIARVADRWWGDVSTGGQYLYEADIPLGEGSNEICWYLDVDGQMRKFINVGFRNHTPFSKKVFLYREAEGKLMYLNQDGNGVLVEPSRLGLRGKLCMRHILSFVKKGKYGWKALMARRVYRHRRKHQKKQIWLVSDRTNRGDDNGEVMYHYLCQNPVEGVEPYFVIDRDTPEWSLLQKEGKVVAPFSKQHKLLFLMSEFLLSSQANKAVVNPFGKLEYLYRDLMYDKRLVFLQHGITKDNQSAWLNKYNRNLFGFIVTTQPEYDSIFEYEYFYEKERVWLTGMPRYDRLYHDEKRYVTVMPTWRKSLSAGTDSAGVWLLGKEFSESEYFDFYNRLLSDERLLAAAEQYNYTVCFMPHPNTIAGLELFDHDERVKFLDATNSYRDVFAQTDLMVTDYSSVAFDFAYLRKPIVYAQFDKEEFFNGEHSYTEGYFDYERDGFGEVEYDLDAVVDRVIEYMKEGCGLKEKYRQRINQTFAFQDKDCCKRVCEAIMKYRN